MKSNDYVKFITQTVIEHLDTPKEERIKRKMEKKKQKETLTYRFFGIAPYAFKEGIKMMKKPKQKG